MQRHWEQLKKNEVVERSGRAVWETAVCVVMPIGIPNRRMYQFGVPNALNCLPLRGLASKALQEWVTLFGEQRCDNPSDTANQFSEDSFLTPTRFSFL